VTLRLDWLNEINAKMHVRLGNVLVPAKDVVSTCIQYTTPLLFDNNDPNFPIQVFGSSFLISFRRRLFQIATGHQLENSQRDYSDVCLVYSALRKTDLLSPQSTFSIKAISEKKDPLTDIRLWQYDVSLLPVLSSRFLKIFSDQFVGVPPLGAQKIFAYFTIAYPLQAVGYELTEDESALAHLRNRYIQLHLEPTKDWLPLIDNRHYFRSIDSLSDINTHPDGFSGAPVFVIYQSDDLQCHMGLVGFITDANSEGTMAVYPAQSLLSSLTTIFDSSN